MAGRVQLLSRVRCFHGVLSRYATTGADGVASTTFSVYVPPSRTTPRPRNLVEAPVRAAIPLAIRSRVR